MKRKLRHPIQIWAHEVLRKIKAGKICKKCGFPLKTTLPKCKHHLATVMAISSVSTLLLGCGHMDDILMGGAAGMAAGMGAPVYGTESPQAPHYPHWYEADSPSWDADNVSSAIRAQTTAIQSMNQ